MFIRKELFLVFVMLAASTTTAYAGVIVDLKFNGRGGLGLSMADVTAHYAGGSYSGWAGQLDITVTGGTDFAYEGDHLVYCTELNEFAGRNSKYFLDTLNNLNVPSSGPAMGIGQKIALEKLFSLVGDVNTNEKAAGFQVAVWEISQDVNFGELTSPNAGNFYLTGSGDTYTNILESANSFLGRLGSQNQVSVLGMISEGSQDFLDATPPGFSGGLSATPEPATLAIFGAIGILACGRRRMRKP